MNLDPAHFGADSPRFDWLVVTASNAKQARSYRQQLEARKPEDESDCEIPGCKRVLVVADPLDKRAGSGGSTFAVLVELARELLRVRPDAKTLLELFEDQQILVLHSGGDARRLPPYAAQGKIFVPVPAISQSGQPLTLFDRVLGDFYSLPRSKRGRLIIGAGDLLLRLEFTKPLLDRPGVVGVSCDATPDRGTRHGVYVTDQAGAVTSFLQKPSLETLAATKAISDAGTVKVDTGVLSIDWPTVCRWLDLLGLRITRGPIEATGVIADILEAKTGNMDLYEHILCLLAPGAAMTHALAANIRAALVAAFAHTPLTVVHLARSQFLHLGTSRELVELGTTGQWGVSLATRDHVSVLSSDISKLKCLGRVFIENSQSSTSVHLDDLSLLIGQPDSTQKVRLDSRQCAVWIPVDEKLWTLIRYPLDFDWKSVDTTKLRELFACRGALTKIGTANPEYLDSIVPRDVDQPTPFHARMWMVGTIADIDLMEKRLKAPQVKMQLAACRAWLAAPRISLAEITARANLSRIQKQHARLTRRWLSIHAKEALQACPLLSTERILEIVREEPDLRENWLQAANEFAASTEGGFAARCTRIASVLRARQLNTRWSPELRESLARCVPASRNTLPPLAAPREFTVLLPARIDLAGGWTDTPPICNDSGGLVINVGIKLSGRNPVRATVRPTASSSVVIQSVDQSERVELPFSSPLKLTDTSDWSALARAALQVTLTPNSATPTTPMGAYLKSGLEISLESVVPKGSGLGTSSILAAALVTALRRYQGHHARSYELYECCQRVSTIEQLIGSCGGWQDQFGGLFTGLKALQTRPGLEQNPTITGFSLRSRIGELLRNRTLFYYTGQQRLAANILQKFVIRYLDRDPATLRIIRAIQNNALELLQALERDDPDTFTRLITEYWLLKRQIDPSASNAMIDGIVAAAAPHIDGYLLPGAGGGGFLLFIAKSVESKQRLVEQLSESPPNPQASFYPIEFDTAGPQLVMV